MIEWLGGVSVLAQPGQPSYQLYWSDITQPEPDLVVAACCGFSESRVLEDALDAPIDLRLLDGSRYFSRPSPSLMESIEVLDRTIGEHLES